MAGAGFKTFTAGAVLTASDVNTYLMQQSTMVFATTTARDAAITSPSDGMICYVNSNDASEGLYTYNGTAWRKGPGWNAPWGIQGTPASKTAQQASITTIVDITDLSVTFTAVTNRYYKVVLEAAFSTSGSGAVAGGIIRNGSTNLQYTNVEIPNPNVVQDRMIIYVSTFTAGSTTVKASAQKNSGAGTLNWYSDTSALITRLWVEDIGPAGAPA